MTEQWDRRDPMVVLVLNLLPFAAAGYLQLGQKKKAIVSAILWTILLLPPSCGTLSVVVEIVAAVDAYLQARLIREGKTTGEWTFFKAHRARAASPHHSEL